MSKLTAHFSLDELIASQTATRKGINNYPTAEVHLNLKELARLLEQVRIYLGEQPIHINSGYRCAELNTLVGGAENSAHLTGRAADFVCDVFGSPYAICKALIDSGVQFDKLINEFNRWVHIQVAAPGKAPRREVYTASRTLNGVVYTKGLK